MEFKTAIKLGASAYNFCEKYNLEKFFSLDKTICNKYPELISRLQSYSRLAKIAICADNGKKTTLNFFNQILAQNNNTYITNLSQNAKLSPVLSSIVLDLSKDLQSQTPPNKDYYSFGFSEEELIRYFTLMKFDYLLLHNIFTDQNDIYSANEKRKKIQDAISLCPKLNLIINADDPYFYEIDENNKRNKFFYGFEKIEFANGADERFSQKNDFLTCPKCATSFDYKKRFYSHLGQYQCECGFKRPALDVRASAKIFNDYTFLDVFYKNNKYVFKIPQGGLYNAYNALGAIALALYLNIERKIITEALEKYTPLRARGDVINYKNKKVKVKLIKNSVSLSESLRELRGIKNIKPIFCLNDKMPDCPDTSWIWDANFSALEGFSNKIFITSNRFDDFALRLKYANVNPALMTLDSSLKSTLECCYWELEHGEMIEIYTTSSLVDEIYKILEK